MRERDIGVRGQIVTRTPDGVVAGLRDRELPCRRAVVERFSVERMADDYSALYRRLLG